MQQADLELLAKGPHQQFDAASIEKFATAQQQVLEKIALNAGLPKGGTPATEDEWRRFVIAGFDFADSQCEDYVAALRRLDIARRHTVQQVNLFGGATAGILGIVGAASSAIAITAIAFGLTAATIDNIAGGLLFELPPSAIRELVSRTRDAYEAKLKPVNWQDRPSSFRTIRGYVELCLPTVIEANATAAIRASEPLTSSAAGGPLGRPPLVQMSGPLRARDPVTPTPPPAPVELAGGLQGAGEQRVTRGMAIDIQKSLCLPPDKQSGNMDSETRAAITQYRTALGRPVDGGLTTGEVNVLADRRNACDRGVYHNAYERFAYPTAARIKDFQGNLTKALTAQGISVPSTGTFDQATRDAIKRLQALNGLQETGDLTPDLMNRIAR